MSKIAAVVNQKGGVGKTTSVMSLGAGLTSVRKKVLLVDLDPQASLTPSLGCREPDELEASVADIISRTVNDEGIPERLGITHVSDNMDLLPFNIQLSATEVSMVNIMSQELVLRYYIEQVREEYDFILTDCTSSLGILIVNTLTSVDSALVPVQAAYLPVKGLQRLIRIIYIVRRRLNSRLPIEGILFIMMNRGTLYVKEVIEGVNKVYGKSIPIFSTEIPVSVRASETNMVAKNIYDYDPKGKVTSAYSALTQEVLKHGC